MQTEQRTEESAESDPLMKIDFRDYEYFHSIINAMSDMVRVLSREGTVLLTNQAFERNFGRTEGQPCFRVFEQNKECDGCITRKVFETGEPRKTTRYFKNRVYSVMASPLIDQKKHITAAVEVFRDITLEHNIKQNLLSQNAKMQRDLQLAKKMQLALVKKAMPEVGEYRFTSGFFPCEAVGGDVFDCAEYGEKLVMYVADVSGHGVMPAMLAVFFTRAIRAAASTGTLSPAAMLAYVQNEFLDLKLEDSIYITAFVATLDLTTNRVAYCNAGLSVLPILYSGGTFREIYMPNTPICDWFEENEFEDDYFEMQRGDRLLIFSDGLFGIHEDAQVQAQLLEMLGAEGFDGKQFIQKVRNLLHNNVTDDLTMLLCERMGEQD